MTRFEHQKKEVEKTYEEEEEEEEVEILYFYLHYFEHLVHQSI
jgi:hypothetical protein